MSEDMAWAKFPKIPQIMNAHREGLLPLEGTFEVTEKMDGANAGIVRKKNGLLIHSRNQSIAFIHENGDMDVENDFRGLPQWVHDRHATFMTYMGTGEHYYGEWLVRHSLAYPREMYGQLYLFDIADASNMSLPHVEEIGGIDTIPSYTAEDILEGAKYLFEWYKESVGRAVEGVVLHHQGTGERFKYVPPEFHEESKKKWSGKADDPAIALAHSYTGRQYVKIREKMQDHHGTLSKKHTPEMLGRCWQDFLEENMGPMLKTLKYPEVDTMTMYKEFQARVREMFFAELDEGSLPQWAMHR